MIVLASHLPGDTPYQSQRFPVTPVECNSELDYWRGLHEHWGSSETIINVEHDIALTDQHLQTLAACPHPACAWAYVCHWVTTHLPPGTIAARHHNGRYLTVGEEWADWAPLGLIKLAGTARCAPLAATRWRELEQTVNTATRGPWHMHWPPVAHHHC